MKRSNKKGFTIVELIVVIAVIAVLTAVLIPTFGGIIKKANLSADQMAVKNMNTALTSAEKYEDVYDAVEVLVASGYNAKDTLVPVSAGHAFYWYGRYNTIVLVDADKNVVFPSDNQEIIDNFASDIASCNDLRFGYSKTEVKDTDDFKDAIANGDNIELAVGTQTITVAESKKYSNNGKSATAAMMVKKGEAVSIDLGGATLATESSSTYGLFVAGSVEITNGTISSRGIYLTPGSSLVLGAGVIIEATGTDGGAAIKNYGGSVIINGGTYKANEAKSLGEITNDTVKSQPQIIDNRGGYVEINGGTFESDSMAYAINNDGGILIINNCTLTAARGGINVHNGTTVINGGTFTTNFDSSAYALYYSGDAAGSSFKVLGGTFKNNGAGHDICLQYNNVEVEIPVLKNVSGDFYENK